MNVVSSKVNNFKSGVKSAVGKKAGDLKSYLGDQIEESIDYLMRGRTSIWADIDGRKTRIGTRKATDI